MKQVLILNNEIIDISDNQFDVHSDFEWHEGPDEVYYDWTFNGTVFTPPSNEKTWEDVRILQKQMILEFDELMTIHEREVAHTGTNEADYTISPAKYQEFLTYFQTIRANDEASHVTPEDAITALEGLTAPSLS